MLHDMYDAVVMLFAMARNTRSGLDSKTQIQKPRPDSDTRTGPRISNWPPKKIRKPANQIPKPASQIPTPAQASSAMQARLAQARGPSYRASQLRP